QKTGVHPIKISGYNPFNVLYDSETAGPGWIVIQQRINGKVDFYRDWNTYVEGFGFFDGDFFLGLESIHLLTNSSQYELYIHMEYFNGAVNYARYDNFKVGGKSEDYELNSLGNFYSIDGTGNNLLYHKGMKFSTFDHGNKACAEIHHGGWWYNSCTAR
ncbi:hypothetical protein KR093_007551, partial [Drosophila rubida]